MEAMTRSTEGAGPGPALCDCALFPADSEFISALRQAMVRTQDWFLGEQQADGHWCAELEGDTILESEYLLLLAYLGRHRTPVAPRRPGTWPTSR